MATQTQDPFSQNQQPKSGSTFIIIIMLIVGFLVIQNLFVDDKEPEKADGTTADASTKDSEKETTDTKDTTDKKDTTTKDNETVKDDNQTQTDKVIEKTDDDDTEDVEGKYPWLRQQYRKTLKESFIANEQYNSEVMEFTFSTRGGTIAEIWLKGFPGGGKDHKKIPENEKNRLRYVRPYDPEKMTGALDVISDDFDLGKNFTRNVEWEFIGHKVTNEIIKKPTINDLAAEYTTKDEVKVETDPNVKTHEVTFVYPPMKAEGEVPFRIFKTFKYTDKEYIIDVDIRVENYTDGILDLDEFVLWGPVGLFTGYGNRISDEAVWKIGSQGETVRESINKFEASYKKQNKELKQAKNSITNVLAKSNMTNGSLTYLGSYNGQFEAVMMTPEIYNEEVRVEEGLIEMFLINGNADVDKPDRVLPSYGFEFNKIRLRKGESIDIKTPMFIGPKKEEFLPEALGDTMLYSFQWINGLGRIMFKLMDFFHGIVADMGIGGAWGIAIILLTILVRIVLMPLSYKAQASMQESQAKMKNIQPAITKIKQKYGDGKKQLTREQKMKMNQEIMGVWKKEGVGMGGMFKGCLIMILQMPIWIALFGVFRNTTDLYGASFLWISDLTKPDAIFMIYNGVPAIPLVGSFIAGTGIFYFNILPFFAVGLMWYQSKLSQAQQPSMSMDDEQAKRQKTTMGCMYIMFFFLFYSFAAGFNLYFLASSGIGVLEAKFIRKRFMKKLQQPEAEGEAPIKSMKKK